MPGAGGVPPMKTLMATLAARTPLSARTALRLRTQLRRAACAALTVASIGYGLIAPPPVVNNSVPCRRRACGAVSDVGGKRGGVDAGVGQLRYQRVELVFATRDQADVEAVAAEDPGDRGAEAGAGSDDGDRGHRCT